MSDKAKEEMWRELKYLDGWQERMTLDRTEAFAAIRRAARYARYNEQRAADWNRNGVQDLADNAAFSADAIRRAIRAAIGSPKV